MPPEPSRSTEPPPRAEYHNLSDKEGQPLAGLLVLLAGDQPTRAELHVGGDLAPAEMVEAEEQARQLLRSRYRLREGSTLALYVLRLDLDHTSDVAMAGATDVADAAAYAARASQRAEPDRDASAGVASERDGSEGGELLEVPIMRRLLPLAAALLIGLGLLLVGWTLYEIVQGQGQQRAATTGAAAAAAAADAGREPGDLAAAPTAAPTATVTPTPEPTPVLRESYCMWPDDTLSEIAFNADVTVDAIMALNPELVAHAGAPLHLPAGSIPPDQWEAPMPEVASIEDLPFGISGYYIGYDNRSKRIALSFDMGYAEGNRELMEYLGERGIRSTVFVLGGAVENHPEIIAEFIDNGHEIANHSYSHDNMLWMTADEVREELNLTETLTQAAYPGATTKPLFRAPFGAINGNVVRVANDAGYHVVGWTVDSADWTEQLNADELYEWVTERVCPGAMIAFHDVNESNGPALPRIIDYLFANGYEFVTVSELLFP